MQTEPDGQLAAFARSQPVEQYPFGKSAERMQMPAPHDADDVQLLPAEASVSDEDEQAPTTTAQEKNAKSERMDPRYHVQPARAVTGVRTTSALRRRSG